MVATKNEYQLSIGVLSWRVFDSSASLAFPGAYKTTWVAKLELEIVPKETGLHWETDADEKSDCRFVYSAVEGGKIALSGFNKFTEGLAVSVKLSNLFCYLMDHLCSVTVDSSVRVAIFHDQRLQLSLLLPTEHDDWLIGTINQDSPFIKLEGESLGTVERITGSLVKQLNELISTYPNYQCH